MRETWEQIDQEFDEKSNGQEVRCIQMMAEEIARLRNIVRAYGQFQTTWAEQQYITGMFVQVPTKVAWATENVRELFAEEIERTLNELQTYMDQRRHLMPKEDA